MFWWPTWSTQQMKDFNDFHMHWYMNDMVNK